MKKMLFAAILAAFFTAPAWCQTNDTAEKDSVEVIIDEDYTPELFEPERASIKNMLEELGAQRIIYDDNFGSIIFKAKNGKYGYINIRTQQQLLFNDMDYIEIVDITGCGLAEGILVQKDGMLGVYTLVGNALIPMVPAESLVAAMRNPFKTSSTFTWGYAIVKNGDVFMAVSTKGEPVPLNLERCAFGINIIMGSIGDDIYVYTPDGSKHEEFVFNISENDVEFVEVEILETEGLGRYDYEGTKYNNITPGLVVKRGHNYTLYPGGQKLSVQKKANNLLIGKADSKKVIFSAPLSKASDALTIISAWSE